MQSDSENCLSFLIFWAQFLQCVLQMERRNSFARAEFETEVDICKNRQLINRPKSNLTGVQITIAEAVSSANWIRKLVKLSESRESFFCLGTVQKKRKVKRVWTICEKTLVEKLWMCLFARHKNEKRHSLVNFNDGKKTSHVQYWNAILLRRRRRLTYIWSEV